MWTEYNMREEGHTLGLVGNGIGRGGEELGLSETEEWFVDERHVEQ